jgi:hypothetical protein
MPKVKTAASSNVKKQTSSGRKKSKIPTGSADTLKKKKAEVHSEYSSSGKTKTAYKGYLDRGHAVLADVVADRREKEKNDPSSPELEGIETDLLAKAFTGPPNKHSVYALELYLTQKCVIEGHGKSTAEGIHGAYAKFWDELSVFFFFLVKPTLINCALQAWWTIRRSLHIR